MTVARGGTLQLWKHLRRRRRDEAVPGATDLPHLKSSLAGAALGRFRESRFALHDQKGGPTRTTV